MAAGYPIPDFPVRVVSASGVAAPAKCLFRTLTAGKPVVVHFYNGG
jgi:hypothetical protein